MHNRPLWFRALSLLISFAWVGASAQAAILANSIIEFSATQGANSWSYGFYNRTADAVPGYASTDFVLFDTFDALVWRASDAQVGANNNDFLQINNLGGHPTGLGPTPQDAMIWAMRRYTSEVAGLVDILFDLRKINVGNPNGNGIVGRIFIDGVEVYTELIGNFDDRIDVQSLTANVNVGSVIDFAIDPIGTRAIGNDSIASARADGSHFSAVIRDHVIASPGTLALLGLGAAVAGFGMRRGRSS